MGLFLPFIMLEGLLAPLATILYIPLSPIIALLQRWSIL